MKEVMTITQAAKLLNVSEDTIRRWVSSGNLPGIDILPGTGAASPVIAPPTPTPTKTEPVAYTASLALRHSRIAGHITAGDQVQPPPAPPTIPEKMEVASDVLTDRLFSASVLASAPLIETDPLDKSVAASISSSPQTDASQPVIEHHDESADDPDDMPPAFIEGLADCMVLLQDAVTALQAAINASLLAHEYAQPLDELRGDLAILDA